MIIIIKPSKCLSWDNRGIDIRNDIEIGKDKKSLGVVGGYF
jgi:hypothetical protein